MNRISDFFTNPYLITGISSWFAAQVIKTVIFAIVHRKLDLSRMVGDGGMPSAHSATVTSVAVMCGLLNGTGSVEFALAFILAIIVCHDASGVRHETGKQAIVINELVETFRVSLDKELQEIRLKEFVGHTPLQVIAGILTGIGNALLMYALFFS
ncbi:MAG: divergent PAP2 family protein [Oscillospiraceae bacterium]|nr:divergent PAP2 family protein [Oscillospiraceae bacterium]